MRCVVWLVHNSARLPKRPERNSNHVHVNRGRDQKLEQLKERREDVRFCRNLNDSGRGTPVNGGHLLLPAHWMREKRSRIDLTNRSFQEE